MFVVVVACLNKQPGISPAEAAVDGTFLIQEELEPKHFGIDVHYIT